MDVVLKKILKKPDKMQLISEFQSTQYQNEDSLKSIYRNRYGAPGKPLPSRIKSVVINFHNVIRWNERVGPAINGEELENLFNDLIKIPYRITTLSDDIAVIDDEVVFIYKFINDKLVIPTIYGRISLKPSLQGLSELKRFNYQQYDKLNLSLPKDILEKQYAPPVPDVAYYFKGSHTTYRLETYKVCEKKIEKIFLTTYSFEGNQRMRELMLDVPEQAKINTKVLYILNCLGYHDLVYEHIKYHNPSKIERFEQKKSEQERVLKCKKEEEQQLSEEKSFEKQLNQKVQENRQLEVEKQQELEFDLLSKFFGTLV